jgi:predicted CoA-binding protein
MDEIADILSRYRTVAVVGLSSDSFRASHHVAEYLIGHGYNIIPVNPNETAVFGRKAYARLEDVPEPVDIVNVFRRPEFVPEIVESAIRVKAPVLWLQEGVGNSAAEALARKAGMQVVSDRCMLKEHHRALALGKLKH